MAGGICGGGGMRGRGARVVRGDAWWGVCVAGGVHGRKTAIAAGSVHPNGMHSCLLNKRLAKYGTGTMVGGGET